MDAQGSRPRTGVNINVHIEKLVLEGLPLTAAQGPGVQAAVQAELARALGQAGDRALPRSEAHRLAPASIQLTAGSSPAQVGRQIARAVHSSVFPTPALRRKKAA
jgi:hypothetical protein